ncbi:MAG: hypothetical protein ACI8Z1_000298 [Candidatus Azotimanducaceae bacterium]
MLTLRVRTMSAAALILAFCTVLLFAVLPAYKAIGTDLIRGGDFDSLTGWRLSNALKTGDGLVQDGVLKLLPTFAGEDLLVRQLIDIPASRQVLIIARGVEITVSDPPSTGQKAAQALPTIALVGRSSSGRLVGGFDNILVRSDTDIVIRESQKVVLIPADHEELWFEIEFHGGMGTLLVDQVQAFEAQAINWVHWARQLLGLGWIALASLVVISFWRLSKVGLGLYIALMSLLIILPAPWGLMMMDENEWLALGLDHVGLFFVFALMSYFLFGKDDPGSLMVPWFAAATSTECLQFYSSYREPLLSDWYSNLVGLILAGLIIFLMARFREINRDVI